MGRRYGRNRRRRDRGRIEHLERTALLMARTLDLIERDNRQLTSELALWRPRVILEYERDTIRFCMRLSRAMIHYGSDPAAGIERTATWICAEVRDRLQKALADGEFAKTRMRNIPPLVIPNLEDV